MPLGAEYLQLARERIDLEQRTADLEPEAPVIDPNRIYNVGGEVTDPVPVRQDPPRYPQWDLRAGTGGEVILRLTISRTGAVEAADVVRSVNPRIDAAAVRAAKNWRYQPARLGGEPVRAFKIVMIRFAAGS